MRRLVAIDIGNTRYHAALYEWQDAAPDDTLQLLPLNPRQPIWHGQDLDEFPLGALPAEPTWWFTVSVHRLREEKWHEWLTRARPADSVHRLTGQQMQVPLAVEHPERVGLDRLAAARTALERRTDGQPVILVDIGTAVTVDYVDEAGVFRGGAIFPGVRAAADALHWATDALPRLQTLPAEPPALPGPHTQGAISAGVYYGVRGAVVELVGQLVARAPARPLVLVGGDCGFVEPLARWHAEWVPDLVLRGVALAGRRWLEEHF
ncbi:MAG: hypothetical protein KatS3mg110_3514 [Pirellulaceae bacterium]|nr:MAG: hypothetical protein KatS3mg110_3514 [Pirellulaceae bacterium]